MKTLIIDVSCDDTTCGDCEGFEHSRNYCQIFQEWVEDSERCAECINAEDVATMLLEEGE